VTAPISLQALWDAPITIPQPPFTPDRVASLPQGVQLYFNRAIAPNTPLAAKVRLQMHGEIKLNNRWYPFQALQVIQPSRGMIWQARTKMTGGIPIKGRDRIVDGAGAMRWRLFGLIPVMSASGADVSHSGAGRLAAELVWLPSALCREDITWQAHNPHHLQAQFNLQGYPIDLHLHIDDTGQLKTVHLKRWGDTGNGDFREAEFGGIAEAETTFDGYTIPTRLRIGWYFGTPRFESEGEFFRVTVDDAEFV
jgi:hypothetical protein